MHKAQTDPKTYFSYKVHLPQLSPGYPTGVGAVMVGPLLRRSRRRDVKQRRRETADYKRRSTAGGGGSGRRPQTLFAHFN
jgi:hypothetical protein